MRQTEKYQFNLIDPEDHFLPDPLNENTEKAEAALNSCARIATGSYVGTGTYGIDNPCTLTFDFAPKFVMVYEKSNMGMLTGYSSGSSDMSYTLVAAHNANASMRQSYINSNNFAKVLDRFTWEENTFSWYSALVNSGSVTVTGAIQLNKEGTTYCYLAIG